MTTTRRISSKMRVVETRFEEAALDDRRAVVERDEAAENHSGIFMDVALELRQVLSRPGNLAVRQDRSI
jgi:hypothetical protein